MTEIKKKNTKNEEEDRKIIETKRRRKVIVFPEGYKMKPKIIARENFYPEEMMKNVVKYLESMIDVEDYYTSPLIRTPKGIQVPIPRKQALIGDKDKTYGYSGIKMKGKGWNKHVYEMMKYTEAFLHELGYEDKKLNVCFVNLYDDENDYVSWHRDAQKDLSLGSVIASASFGATRRFSVRQDSDHKNVYNYDLKNNTLLFMFWSMNRQFMHTIRKTTKKVSRRWNLTFRDIP